MSSESPEPKKPTCFVAMPITTTPELAAQYKGDEDHFIHVLECLFAPAIEAAGYDLISPIATGSEFIHAEIIQALETADMVLVDMSILNANVFFEFGIRTALDLPIALVVDDATLASKRIPFDTAPTNHLKYNSGLEAWTLEKDRTAIAQHIRNTAAKAGRRNALWKWFGLRKRGEAPPAGTKDEKLDTILEELARIRSQMATRTENRTSVILHDARLITGLIQKGCPINSAFSDAFELVVFVDKDLDERGTGEVALGLLGQNFKAKEVRIVHGNPTEEIQRRMTMMHRRDRTEMFATDPDFGPIWKEK